MWCSIKRTAGWNVETIVQSVFWATSNGIHKHYCISSYASFPDSQAAYQPARGTIEQIIALEQIIEESIEFKNPVYIVFIDFTKAFDSIKLDCLWKLEESSLNKRYINLLKLSYENATVAIKTDIWISRPVKILKGVKQGDVLSALLFWWHSSH